MIISHPIKNDFDMGPSNINYIKAARGGGILCFTLKSFHAREKCFNLMIILLKMSYTIGKSSQN